LHVSVLEKEVLGFLKPVPGEIAVDATLGNGGHSRGILRGIGPAGFLVGIDQDDEAILRAKQELRGFSNAALINNNFRNIDLILETLSIPAVDMVLFDLGVSREQLDSEGRGFSFRRDGPLDMRMDRQGEVSAADLVNTLSAGELGDILFRLGEERKARKIAARIVERRQRKPFETTEELARTVGSCFPGWQRIHPATRTFQALRIAVNGELDAFQEGLKKALDRLKPAGRIVVLSYHSLEDRIAKQTFASYSKEGKIDLLTKMICPTPEEIEKNPSARSAKLRAIQKKA